jgi:hypothetical protein
MAFSWLVARPGLGVADMGVLGDLMQKSYALKLSSEQICRILAMQAGDAESLAYDPELRIDWQVQRKANGVIIVLEVEE